MVNYVYFDFSLSLLFFHFVNCSETTSTFLILGIKRYINAVVVIIKVYETLRTEHYRNSLTTKRTNKCSACKT